MSPAGRPKGDTPPKKVVSFRLTADDIKLLKECQEQLSISQYEVIRMGIKAVHEGLKKK